mgnify:CR=1 FL=1
MGTGGGSKKQAAPPPPPPSVDTEGVRAAGDEARKRARAAAGRASTMLTGSKGVTDGVTGATKKLLGQ